ncbi:hypothetical protein CONPUDRAFT_147471 [Coniophora puteana RWD-64-598 SS2]|uniref:Uncharacterized protein n=1 Tax=Coniophora puteana (strain RWD-64-598) TaxID=741705 RepID=A0A5M3M664_CONPW|nr:uncharacterized protein CONPUDRAFT_147471 [Coniophora puteana RWD-64-598 SS2]EIW74848.1 hypothetical protein CONPUDRAFT_147471 [Coniophora puteana RWD-64-598 SS2]
MTVTTKGRLASSTLENSPYNGPKDRDKLSLQLLSQSRAAIKRRRVRKAHCQRKAQQAETHKDDLEALEVHQMLLDFSDDVTDGDAEPTMLYPVRSADARFLPEPVRELQRAHNDEVAPQHQHLRTAVFSHPRFGPGSTSVINRDDRIYMMIVLSSAPALHLRGEIRKTRHSRMYRAGGSSIGMQPVAKGNTNSALGGEMPSLLSVLLALLVGVSYTALQHRGILGQLWADTAPARVMARQLKSREGVSDAGQRYELFKYARW